MPLSDMRKTYDRGELTRASVDPDPIEQFGRWLNEALGSDMIEPTAMTLATVGTDGQPSARMVLLKGVDGEGFVFYSNYQSRKGRELAANPQAALVFYWDRLERQVRVEGQVTKTTRKQSEAYFKSRPHGSQLGAAASPQSQVVENRAVLAERLERLKERFDEGEVPLPETWGGYCLTPEIIEFWQGRPNRLHDRLRYVREGETWRIERLAP